MKIFATIVPLLFTVASAKRLRGQDGGAQVSPGDEITATDTTMMHGRNTGFLDEFLNGFPSFGGDSEDSDSDSIDRSDVIDDLTPPRFDDFVLDNNNFTDKIDDFFDRINVTDSDWLPPCPPDDFLEKLNMTQEDISCDPDFEFTGGNFSDIISNFTELIPCPSDDILDRLNVTVDDLPCNPDVDFGNFTGGDFSFGNFTDMVPCPPEGFLDRLNITQDDLPCNPDLEFPDFEDRFNITRPGDEGSDALECADDETVTCGLLGDRTGIVVCRESAFGGRTFDVCVDRVLESDTCGCCDGACPQACTSECEDGETIGVMLESRFGSQRCVSVQNSVSLQLTNLYSCASP